MSREPTNAETVGADIAERETASETPAADLETVTAESETAPTVRERVEGALDGETFVAAFRRRTEGPPSDPSVRRDRFEAATDLPDTPFDARPMRTELVVYSETHVHRWVVTAGTVERTRLPRDPATFASER